MPNPQSKFSEFILEKIQHEKIKPIPRWQFIALSVAINLILIFTVLLGSLAIGILLRDIFATDWGMMLAPGRQRFDVFFKLIPYIWVIFLAFSVWFAKYVYSRTRKGYKHSPAKIILVMTLVSLLLGIVHYQFGSAHRFDRFLRQGIPPYQEMRMNRDTAFNSPEDGLLAGMVKEIKDNILVLDVPGSEQPWQVSFPEDLKNTPNLQVDYIVNLIGEKTGENTFVANEIRVLGCPFCDHEGDLFRPLPPEEMKETSEPERIN